MISLKQYLNLINRFPAVSNAIASKTAKKLAEGTRKEIQKGLLQGDLVQPALKPLTVMRKRAKGYTSPKKPLIGRGESNRRSMVNGLTVKKVSDNKKTGRYSVFPSGKHWSGVSQSLLWRVHELGASIANGFGRGIKIVIPARRPVERGAKRFRKKQLQRALKNAAKDLADAAAKGKVPKQ